MVYRLRRPWSDGTSAIVFEPLAFLERLAALVPRPRAHLLTYHGVLAPAAQWRDRIVPGPRAPAEPHYGPQECNTAFSHLASGSTDSPAALSDPARTRRLRWAELLRRVSAVDVLTCPPLRRGAPADRHDHRRARRAQDPRTTSSCQAPRRRSPQPERLQNASRARVRLVGRHESELRASKRGAVWRRHAHGPLPSASNRLESAPEATQGSRTDVGATGSAPPRPPATIGWAPKPYWTSPGSVDTGFSNSGSRRRCRRIVNGEGVWGRVRPSPSLRGSRAQPARSWLKRSAALRGPRPREVGVQGEETQNLWRVIAPHRRRDRRAWWCPCAASLIPREPMFVHRRPCPRRQSRPQTAMHCASNSTGER